jgi:hypothetical protein
MPPKVTVFKVLVVKVLVFRVLALFICFSCIEGKVVLRIAKRLIRMRRLSIRAQSLNAVLAGRFTPGM